MDPSPTLSIIIPTIGRRTLERAIASTAAAIEPGDEVVLVGDGAQPHAREVAAAFPFVRYLESQPTRCFGHAQRSLGMAQATGEYLAFMDDDDVYTDGGIAIIKSQLASRPRCPVLFRMHHHGEVLWKVREIVGCNVSTQMIVTPNSPERLGRWQPPHSNTRFAAMGGDFTFISETVANWGGEVLWNENIVARLDKHSFGHAPG